MNRSNGINYKHMRFAVAAFEAGSFRKAANSLEVKQSTISRCISDLESAVGVLIFTRLPGGVKLTPSGAMFLTLAREALQTFDKALRYKNLEDDRAKADSSSIIFEGRWIATKLVISQLDTECIPLR